MTVCVQLLSPGNGQLWHVRSYFEGLNVTQSEPVFSTALRKGITLTFHHTKLASFLVICGNESVAWGNNTAYKAACCTATAGLQVFKPLATKPLLLPAVFLTNGAAAHAALKQNIKHHVGYDFRQGRCTLVFVKHALTKSDNDRGKE